MNQKKVYAIPALLGMAICFLCVVPVAASDDATASVGPTAVSFSSRA